MEWVLTGGIGGGFPVPWEGLRGEGELEEVAEVAGSLVGGEGGLPGPGIPVTTFEHVFAEDET